MTGSSSPIFGERGLFPAVSGPPIGEFECLRWCRLFFRHWWFAGGERILCKDYFLLEVFSVSCALSQQQYGWVLTVPNMLGLPGWKTTERISWILYCTIAVFSVISPAVAAGTGGSGCGASNTGDQWPMPDWGIQQLLSDRLHRRVSEPMPSIHHLCCDYCPTDVAL